MRITAERYEEATMYLENIPGLGRYPHARMFRGAVAGAISPLQENTGSNLQGYLLYATLDGETLPVGEGFSRLPLVNISRIPADRFTGKPVCTFDNLDVLACKEHTNRGDQWDVWLIRVNSSRPEFYVNGSLDRMFMGYKGVPEKAKRKSPMVIRS